jgi:hypothetical protein
MTQEQDNIERVAWTLQDPDWKPTRAYVVKMLGAYKEAVAEVERLRSNEKAQMDGALALIVADNTLHADNERLTAARELMQLDAEKYRAERDLWKERTEQGSLIIEGNVAEITRLQAENAMLAEMPQEALNRMTAELRAEIERLRTTVNDQAATITKLLDEVWQLQEQIRMAADRDIRR